MTDMFSPISSQELENAADKSSKKDDSVAIIPIPSDVPKEIPIHPLLGEPKKIWKYLDAQGQYLFAVLRFFTVEGKKEDRPLSYRQYKDGTKRWAYKGLDTPRPLYGLDRLAKSPDALVVVCEGEKATDAATSLFSDCVAVTSPNGAGSPHKADWTALSGRHVVIWPDNDNDGQKYAQNVAMLAKNAGAEFTGIVMVPDEFPNKWDLADQLPEHYSHGDLDRLLKNAYLIVDPLENLIEQAQFDPGSAYKIEVIDALSSLERNDMPAFITLRSKLKKSGVGVTLLDAAIKKRRIDLGENEVGPDHLKLAREIISHIGNKNLLGTSAHVWIWKSKGVWQPITDREVKQYVQRTLEMNGHLVFRSQVDSVTDVLKTAIFAQEHKWDDYRDTVNLLNGELHWQNDSWILKPHCREHYRTTQIPVLYDPQTDCPRFKKFLTEIFRDDAEKEDKAQAVLEMIGYTMMSHAKFERFILLTGSGANGKSVLMEVVKALVGTGNVAAVQPSQLSNKFQRAHLHLKLANLVTEIAEGGEIADAELKAITSGELTTAEHKNKDPFNFSPFCTCWFGANHLPHTRDFSDALFRRALVIPFNQIFKAGVGADPNLKTKLLKELPGIMNLALSAFGKVLERGAFTEPQSCLDAKQEWRLEADQAAQFVQERCIIDPEVALKSSELYIEYEHWAKEVGITRKLNRKNFTQRIQRLGCKTARGTRGVRMIYGIRLATYLDEEKVA